MFNRFLNAVSIGTSGFWFWMASLVALVVGTFGVGFFAILFHTSMVGALGISVMVLVVIVMLGVSLGLETRLRRRDEDIPSWLHKGNRILTAIALSWAVSQVLFQSGMVLGAFLHFPSVLAWVIGLDLLIMMVVAGCAYAAVSFGAVVGREFGLALGLFILAGNLLMAMINTGESLVDPAVNGELYVVWDTASCAAEPGHEVPEVTTGWYLTVSEHHLIGDDVLVNRNWCEAIKVDPKNLDHKMWVRLAQMDKDAHWLDRVLSAAGWLGAGLVGVFVAAGLGILGFNTLRGLANKTVTGGTVLTRIFVCVMILAVVMCMGLSTMRLFGLTPEVEARSLRHELVGGPNPFYRTFTVGPQAKTELGVPDQTEIGHLCFCGVGANLAYYGQWTAWAKYSAEMYPMYPHGCGALITFEGDQMYYAWNRGRQTTAPIQFLRAGESMTCPDMTVVTAPL